MKTKTEEELEREIERKDKVYGKGYFNEEVECEKKELKAKLEGYRLAKEEFMKKVEELKEEINYVILANETDIEQGYEGAEVGKHINAQLKIILEKIDKIFGEEEKSK
ncbi:MAG: hypothetical protein ACTSYG_10905 [Candidatus Heimdallarchaeota archaeon]